MLDKYFRGIYTFDTIISGDNKEKPKDPYKEIAVNNAL